MLITDLPQAFRLCSEANIPMMLWGDTGEGKTEAIKTYFQDEGYETVMLHAAQMDGAELQGLPWINNGKADIKDVTTEFAPLGFLPQDKKFVLFLDELNRGQSSVLQALFQLINDRTIGRRKYDCYIVAACNPNVGEFQVNELGEALLARFIHIGVNNTSKLVAKYLQKKYSSVGDCPYIAYFHYSNSRTSTDYNLPPINISHGRRKEWAVQLYLANQKLKIDKDIYFEVLTGAIPQDEAMVLGKYFLPVSLDEIAKKGEKTWLSIKYKEEEVIATIFSMIEYCKNKLSLKEQENIALFMAWCLEKWTIKDFIFGTAVSILQNALQSSFKHNVKVHPEVLISILQGSAKHLQLIQGNIVNTIYNVFVKKGLENEIVEMFQKVDVDKLIEKAENESKLVKVK